MYKLLKFAIILFGIGLITSCTNSEDNAEKKKLDASDIAVDENNTHVSGPVDFMLPRPFALITSFEKAGMKFESSRMNPPENVNQYTTEGKQLLNFGVYSADLVYSIINDQTQASIDNFNAIKELGGKLGMGSIFNEEELAHKIEENIADRSEMEKLLVDMHEKSQEYLASNEMRELAAVQFSGAWIEGMYLATFELYKKDTLLMSNIIVNHMTLLEHVINAIDNYDSQRESWIEILTELQKLQTKYNNLESIKNTQDFPKLKSIEVEEVAAKIYAIRQLIIA